MQRQSSLEELAERSWQLLAGKALVVKRQSGGCGPKTCGEETWTSAGEGFGGLGFGVSGFGFGV